MDRRFVYFNQSLSFGRLGFFTTSSFFFFDDSMTLFLALFFKINKTRQVLVDTFFFLCISNFLRTNIVFTNGDGFGTKKREVDVASTQRRWIQSTIGLLIVVCSSLPRHNGTASVVANDRSKWILVYNCLKKFHR